MEASKAGHKPKSRREYADEQLFARLIGAAVLLAIAVIVLPFVLDGSGSQREYEYAETLPVEPPRPVIEKSFSSRQPVEAGPAPETVSVRNPPTTSTVSLEVPAESALTRTHSQVKSQTSAAVKTAGSVDQFETIGNGSSIRPIVNQQPVGQFEAIPIQRGWNIQVASFVRDANATKLINKLRAQNLGAYANRVQGKNRSVVRVIVGPYDNQIDALARQNQIDRDYRVESLIVRGK